MQKGLCGQPIFTKTENEVKHNVKVKFYPDGRNTMTVTTKPIFLEKGFDKCEDKKINITEEQFECINEQRILNDLEPLTGMSGSWWIRGNSKTKNMENETRDDSVRRARQKVFDISRLNLFKWFVTWTLDKNEIDRYDKSEVSKRLKKYLDNKVQRNAAVYMIIPEYHKDGAIHMHGLLDGNFKMVDSGKKTKGGQTIYNMPDWKLGYSTAIELDDNVRAISNYITKYISKDFKKIFGSFYYAGGHGLIREPPIALYDINYSEINTKEYTKYGVGYKFLELGDYSDDVTAEILERLISCYENE